MSRVRISSPAPGNPLDRLALNVHALRASRFFLVPREPGEAAPAGYVARTEPANAYNSLLPPTFLPACPEDTVTSGVQQEGPTMVCPTCGTRNPTSAKFCLNCGAALASPMAAAGERKIVTILFADVVGSTAMAERVDPEDWTDIMNGATRFMNAAVVRYEGTVGRLMGDAILALFGAPTAHENDAERAVRAGLDILEDAASYAAELRGYGLDFAVRVGINTGLTVLTTVGDATKAEYTAMGDPANVAARLQGLAAPGTLLIGPDTRALVRHVFELRPRGVEVIRGRQEPLTTYEVVGLADSVTSARGIEGASAGLVGRQRELARLRERLAALANGDGGLVGIIAEAGLGKSRLLSEARASDEGGVATWLFGRSVSYARTDPYHPWAEVVINAIGASPGDDAASLREKLAAHTSENPEARPFLEALIGVESDAAADAVAGVDGAVLALRIADAVTQHLITSARSRPLVVVLEDLHWADAASVELALTVAERVAEHPILLLVATRPDHNAPSHELIRRAEQLPDAAAVLLRLEPLDSEAALTLLQGLADIRDLPAATRDRIVERADGNPFYLEEVFRALIDSGHAVKEDGRWRVTGDVGSVPIPDTLEALLGARIDGLPPAARQVAQTASVIGRTFRSQLLGRVLKEDLPTRDLELAPQLDTLTHEDVVRLTAPEPECEYAFKHALTQEAAYERLLVRRRRELHLRVAEELERLPGERLAELAPVLAYHYRLGEAWPQTGRYALLAATRARHLYALAESLEYYENALDAMERGQVDEGDPEAAGAYVDAVVGWIDACIASRAQEQPEKAERIRDRVERAIARAREVSDERRLVRALVAKGNALALSGFPGTAFGALAEAHDIAARLGDDRLFLLPFWAATEKLVDNDPKAAAERFEQVIRLARSLHNHAIEAHALGSRAVSLSRLGRFQEALEVVATGLEVVARTDSTIKEADVIMMAGATFLDLGWAELAAEYASDGAELALGVGGFECACNGLYLRGLGRMASEQRPLAVADFDTALRVGAGTAFEDWLHNVRVARAKALSSPGEASERVAAEVSRELANAIALNDGFGAAHSELILADLLLPLERVQEAEEHVRRALAWYRERDMKPYVERSLRTLGAVLEAKRDVNGAARAHAEAEAIHGALMLAPEVAGRLRARIESAKVAARRQVVGASHVVAPRRSSADAAAPSADLGA